MARPAGARNADYFDRRNALIERVRDRLALQQGTPPSFRELALAAGCSVATLRHYFGSREGLIRDLFTVSRESGERHLARARTLESGDLEASLTLFLRRIVEGWTHGRVGELHRIGLAEGLRNPRHTGLDYLVEILEPTLQALEQRLQGLIASGAMAPAETRHAALMLLSPIVLALLHQHDLGGTRCRPLDVPTLIEEHVRVFARAYRA
jgi:AcrR family transcriptional regulator